MKEQRECLYYSADKSGSLPFMDIYETAESLVFEIDLPGIYPEDVSIKVYDDIVIIEGVKRERPGGAGYRYLCMERSFESFRRMVKIPVRVNTMAGKATYSEGIVKLAFPKIKDKVIRISIEKE
ncbi:MAG: Hsp20/alpha crystallin family protein [Nitrospirae bacterium]|nr:Hsp20/alpha crystallin family protein [Nitrospirota bacterium]